MNYVRILSEFYGRCWALPEDLLLRMQDFLSSQAAGVKWSDGEIQDRIASANGRSGYQDREHLDGVRYLALGPATTSGSHRGRTSGKVGIIPVTGIISHRMNLVSEISGGGGTSIQKLQSQFRECLRDVDCTAVVFDIDSPGGGCDGVVELASEIFAARQQKPSISICNALAGSAAYWLASAAGQVCCTPSGQAGSIGVYLLHEDDSEALKKDGIKITVIKAGTFKAEGIPSEPLSREAHDAFQAKVNSVYGMFVKSVAQGRGVTQAAVREGMGQGRCLLAADAVRAGLVDRVATLDEVLSQLGVGGRGRPGMGKGAASRDAGVFVGDATEVPGLSPAAKQFRLELDLARMVKAKEAPDGAAQRRRQLWLDAQR